MARDGVKKPQNDKEHGRVQLGRLDEFVGFRLRRIQNQLSRDFYTATADRNLRSGLFTSLGIIVANPGISQNELSKAVGLDKSITVQIVDELESRGLASRERSPTDRRRHALFATDAGKVYLEELFEILTRVEDTVMHQLTKAEMGLLRELLDRMYEVFEGPDVNF